MFQKRPICRAWIVRWGGVFPQAGLARALPDFACAELKQHGFHDAYLLTGHMSFGERCGWEFLYFVEEEDGGTARMYHRKRTNL